MLWLAHTQPNLRHGSSRVPCAQIRFRLHADLCRSLWWGPGVWVRHSDRGFAPGTLWGRRQNHSSYSCYFPSRRTLPNTSGKRSALATAKSVSTATIKSVEKKGVVSAQISQVGIPACPRYSLETAVSLAQSVGKFATCAIRSSELIQSTSHFCPVERIDSKGKSAPSDMSSCWLHTLFILHSALSALWDKPWK